MTTDHGPTMVGFVWSPTAPYVPTKRGEDGWCLRNAICELFEWEPGSAEWSRFVEGPEGQDMPRLAEHLGPGLFDLSRDWNALITRLDHPGVAYFDFPDHQKSHVIYVHDIQWLLHHWSTPDELPSEETAERQLVSYSWPLPPQYVARGPALRAVIVDER